MRTKVAPWHGLLVVHVHISNSTNEWPICDSYFQGRHNRLTMSWAYDVILKEKGGTAISMTPFSTNLILYMRPVTFIWATSSAVLCIFSSNKSNLSPGLQTYCFAATYCTLHHVLNSYMYLTDFLRAKQIWNQGRISQRCVSRKYSEINKQDVSHRLSGDIEFWLVSLFWLAQFCCAYL